MFLLRPSIVSWSSKKPFYSVHFASSPLVFLLILFFELSIATSFASSKDIRHTEGSTNSKVFHESFLLSPCSSLDNVLTDVTWWSLMWGFFFAFSQVNKKKRPRRSLPNYPEQSRCDLSLICTFSCLHIACSLARTRTVNVLNSLQMGSIWSLAVSMGW